MQGEKGMRTNGMIQTHAMHKRVHGDNHISRLQDQLCEECGELIAAIMHWRRGRHISTVYEEMADVWICMDTLLQSLDEEKFKEEVNHKTELLNSRLEKLT
jgi:hypothetical protein